MTKKKFYLHKWCIPIKGVLRSTINDVEKQIIKLIPNDLCDILLDYNGSSIESVYQDYKDKKIVDDYFNFLLTNEFIFISDGDQKELIENFSPKNDLPEEITNAIIDFSIIENINLYKQVVEELDDFNCKSIQFRFFSVLKKDSFLRVLSLIKNKGFRQVDIVVGFHNFISIAFIENLLANNPRIKSVFIFNSPENKQISINSNKVFFTKNQIKSNNHCGIISKKYFILNRNIIANKLNSCNSCLHKKVGIDVDGNIKNCPSMKESFGNIHNMDNIKNAINHINFKKIWGITKNVIKVCNECEFRLVCTDCRAYLQDSDDMFSKPLKCGYNPHLGKWEEWYKNSTSKKSIDFYKIKSYAN